MSDCELNLSTRFNFVVVHLSQSQFIYQFSKMTEKIERMKHFLAACKNVGFTQKQLVAIGLPYERCLLSLLH